MELLIKTQISFFLIQLWDKVVEACMLTKVVQCSYLQFQSLIGSFIREDF